MVPGFEAQFVYNLQQYFLQSPLDIGLIVFLARWLILANVFIAAYLALTNQPKKVHAIGEALWSLILALVMTTVISILLQRLRPYLVVPSIELLIPPPLNSSFPSGHTASAVALALPFLYASRGAGWMSLGVAVLVAAGRMAAGVHYPSDILGGALVGGLAFYLVRFGHGQLRRSDILKSVHAWHRRLTG